MLYSWLGCAAADCGSLERLQSGISSEALTVAGQRPESFVEGGSLFSVAYSNVGKGYVMFRDFPSMRTV